MAVEAVETQNEPRPVALDLHGSVGRVFELLRVEPRKHPADRSRLVTGARRVDRARDDEAVDRTRHRDVVEAPSLRLGSLVLDLLHLLVVGGREARSRRRIGNAEAEATVGQAEDLVRVARCSVAACVGDDDDLELEALRAVDREQPDDIGALLLGNRFELGGADDALLANEAHEALDVGPAQLLVRARQPRQLAQVRVAAPPVPLREHREVVVVVGDHALAETLEGEPRSETCQAVVALLERAEELGVAIREARRQRALEPDEQGPALGSPPQVHERVVRHAHERRGENGDERLVVVAVVQEPQVGRGGR